jgi:hypothetical protein
VDEVASAPRAAVTRLAGQLQVRTRHLEQQAEQAGCLTLVTNAVVTWTTEYYGLAVETMRRSGRRIDDGVLAHSSPAHSENINFSGSIDVDIEGELAQLDPIGYRPPRVRDTLFRGSRQQVPSASDHGSLTGRSWRGDQRRQARTAEELPL